MATTAGQRVLPSLSNRLTTNHDGVTLDSFDRLLDTARFATPDAKLIRFIGRRPRASFFLPDFVPRLPRAPCHAREEANPHRDARRPHVTARRTSSAIDVVARIARDVRRSTPAIPFTTGRPP